MAEVKPIPEGCEGSIAHLVVDGAAEAIEFYKRAFGAEEICRMPMPGGDKLMHAELTIGGSRLMLADDFPDMNEGKARSPKALGGSPVTIHHYVLDVDAAMTRATEAGASIKMPAMDMFWGDRYGIVIDPYGHVWSFATHIKDLSPEEMEEAASKAFCN